jgi:vacuolar-type H+-ATPase subunit C/Vma6
MAPWIDLVARARGLSTDLLGRDRLRELAASPDLPAFAASLRNLDFAVPEECERSPVMLDRQARRMAAGRISVLARWADHRVPLLAPLIEDEDRRSLRAIIRGILGATPVESRTSGLIPTPALPEAALAELAAQPTVAAIATLLTAWGSEYGAAILRESERQHPDAFALQTALDRVFFTHASRAARKVGEPLRCYVRLMIDLENAWTALAGAAGQLERDAQLLFIEGGESVTREQFTTMINAAAPTPALALLLHNTESELLRSSLTTRQPWWNAEDGALAALLTHYRQTSRLHPLAADTVILCLLRVRAEARDLARLIWGIVLGVPRDQLIAELVTC